jgi:hypothetical protein
MKIRDKFSETAALWVIQQIIRDTVIGNELKHYADTISKLEMQLHVLKLDLISYHSKYQITTLPIKQHKRHHPISNIGSNNRHSRINTESRRHRNASFKFPHTEHTSRLPEFTVYCSWCAHSLSASNPLCQLQWQPKLSRTSSQWRRPDATQLTIWRLKIYKTRLLSTFNTYFRHVWTQNIFSFLGRKPKLQHFTNRERPIITWKSLSDHPSTNAQQTSWTDST